MFCFPSHNLADSVFRSPGLAFAEKKIPNHPNSNGQVSQQNATLAICLNYDITIFCSHGLKQIDNFPWRVVPLQSFDYFYFISMIDKSIDHKKLLHFFFNNNIDNFLCPFPVKFLGQSRAQEREKTNCATIKSFP